jgi:hypothetical protein
MEGYKVVIAIGSSFLGIDDNQIEDEYTLEEILGELGHTKEEWNAMKPKKRKKKLNKFAQRQALETLEYSIKEAEIEE